MDGIIALCDGANPPSDLQIAELPALEIRQYPPARNLRLEIENVSHGLLKNLSSVSLDLLDIAAYVYYADGSIKRGTNKDVFAEQWMRKLVFVIPVRCPDFWQQESVKSLLIKLLGYLTEDSERRSDWASLIPDYHASLESAWQLDGKDWNWHIRDHYVCGDRQLTFLIVQRYTWQRLAIVVMPWVEHGFATGRCRAYLLAKLAEEEEGQ